MKIAIVGLAIPHPTGKELKRKVIPSGRWAEMMTPIATATMNYTACRQNILKSWCEETYIP